MRRGNRAAGKPERFGTVAGRDRARQRVQPRTAGKEFVWPSAHVLRGDGMKVLSIPNVEVTGAVRLYRAASVWSAELGIFAITPASSLLAVLISEGYESKIFFASLD